MGVPGGAADDRSELAASFRAEWIGQICGGKKNDARKKWTVRK